MDNNFAYHDSSCSCCSYGNAKALYNKDYHFSKAGEKNPLVSLQDPTCKANGEAQFWKTQCVLTAANPSDCDLLTSKSYEYLDANKKDILNADVACHCAQFYKSLTGMILTDVFFVDDRPKSVGLDADDCRGSSEQSASQCAPAKPSAHEHVPSPDAPSAHEP